MENINENTPVVTDENEAVETVMEPSEELSKEVSKPASVNNDKTIIDELGIISENTSVTGDVSTKGHLAVYGKIKGNVSANGNVMVSGDIAGDIACDNLKLTNCSVVANSKVNNSVVIEENSQIKGKIVCSKISVDGCVYGDIEADEEVAIYENATVIGNIKTKTLSVESGAQLQGNISMEK